MRPKPRVESGRRARASGDRGEIHGAAADLVGMAAEQQQRQSLPSTYAAYTRVSVSCENPKAVR
jgi:hypothetical protein